MRKIIMILLSLACAPPACGKYYEYNFIDISQYPEVLRGKEIAEACKGKKIERNIKIFGLSDINEVRSICGLGAEGCIVWDQGIIALIHPNKIWLCHIAAHEYVHELQLETGNFVGSEPYKPEMPQDPCNQYSFLTKECSK